MTGLLGNAGLVEIVEATHAMLDSHAGDVADLIFEVLGEGENPNDP